MGVEQADLLTLENGTMRATGLIALREVAAHTVFEDWIPLDSRI